MDKFWTITAATGKRIDLECGYERMELHRPRNMSIQEFNRYRAGMQIHDQIIMSDFGRTKLGK
jgi:hypothetical protein